MHKSQKKLLNGLYSYRSAGDNILFYMTLKYQSVICVN
jgi:hypothetical protein